MPRPTSRSPSARLGNFQSAHLGSFHPAATGLIDRKPPGQPSRLTDGDRAAVAAVIESGPIPSVHGVVRWRIIDLCQWFWEERRVKVAKQTLSRELRRMGYRKLSAGPRHHAQVAGAIEHFKKAFPTAWRRSPRRAASDVRT